MATKATKKSKDATTPALKKGMAVKFSLAFSNGTQNGVKKGSGVIQALVAPDAKAGARRLTVVDAKDKTVIHRPYPSQCRPA